ncbi:MAG: class I SAM-dependent methyltransferase [Burkholderiales bacterium]|nr:class I SAM-dependent methyltransferase [Burkholderiales bacterium]
MVAAGPDGGGARDAWGEFWRVTDEAAAHAAGGAQEGALRRFWRESLGDRLARGRVLDLACGNGAVSGVVSDLCRDAGLPLPSLVGADGAATAAMSYRSRFAGGCVVVADSRRLPFPDGAFALVASQFGIEYGGVAAVGEAARLVASGGRLAAVLHLRGGAIHRECEASLAAMLRLQASRALPAAREVFRRAAAVARGHGSRGEFRRADERLAAAMAQVEAILRESGAGVAGGAVLRLHEDLAHLRGRLAAHDPGEVSRWVDAMEGEVEAYRARMAAMLAVALDDAGVREATSLVSSKGLATRRCEALLTGPGEPGAWALVCDRP